MARLARLLFWCGWLIVLAVSCQALNTNTPVPSVTPGTPPNWWTSWLAHPVCKPPCWENITPGATTIDEAVSFLQYSPEFTNISNSKYGVSWVFRQNKNEGGTLGASQDGIVDVIWIGSVSDQKLLVKTIATSYQYPKFVKPNDCREGMCEALLIYPDLGMFLSIYVENTGTISMPQFEILPDAGVDRVYFFKAGMESFEQLSFQDYDLLMEWKGYGKYP